MDRELTPTQERALSMLRHPMHAGKGMPYRGSSWPVTTWDVLARRGLVLIEWTSTGARPDGVVHLVGSP